MEKIEEIREAEERERERERERKRKINERRDKFNKIFFFIFSLRCT